MIRWIVMIVAAAALMFAAAAQAQTTIGDAGPGSGSGWIRAGREIGQTFTVPAGVRLLTEVQLAATSRQQLSPSRTISLHLVTADIPGPAIQTETWPTVLAAPLYSMLSLTPHGGGLPVTPGEVYLIRVNDEVNSPEVPFVEPYYSGGSIFNGYTSYPYNSYFTATFAAAPAPIPTLSEWAMILLGVVLAGTAALTIQRRRTT